MTRGESPHKKRVSSDTSISSSAPGETGVSLRSGIYFLQATSQDPFHYPLLGHLPSRWHLVASGAQHTHDADALLPIHANWRQDSAFSPLLISILPSLPGPRLAAACLPSYVSLSLLLPSCRNRWRDSAFYAATHANHAHLPCQIFTNPRHHYSHTIKGIVSAFSRLRKVCTSLAPLLTDTFCYIHSTMHHTPLNKYMLIY